MLDLFLSTVRITGQNIGGKDGKRRIQEGENTQEIPTFDGIAAVSLIQFIAAIVILVMLTIIIGYRNHVTRVWYWVISAIEVVALSISWLFLAIMTDLVVFTHISLPVEVKPIIIDILNILSYLGLCILLVITEMYRRPSKSKSEKATTSTE